LVLPKNHRPFWKGLSGTNTLAFHELIKVVKRFITLGPEPRVWLDSDKISYKYLTMKIMKGIKVIEKTNLK
jgi:hypothetical protein